MIGIPGEPETQTHGPYPNGLAIFRVFDYSKTTLSVCVRAARSAALQRSAHRIAKKPLAKIYNFHAKACTVIMDAFYWRAYRLTVSCNVRLLFAMIPKWLDRSGWQMSYK